MVDANLLVDIIIAAELVDEVVEILRVRAADLFQPLINFDGAAPILLRFADAPGLPPGLDLPGKFGRRGRAAVVSGHATIEDIEVELHRIVGAPQLFQAFRAAHRRFVAVGNGSLFAFQDLIESGQRLRVVGRIVGAQFKETLALEQAGLDRNGGRFFSVARTAL